MALNMAKLIFTVLFVAFFQVKVNAAATNYFIDCGSSQNTTIGNRVFMADQYSLKFLSPPQDTLASVSANSSHTFPHLPIYRTARIFTDESKYSLPITLKGRYFIRLHFFPFNHETHKMSIASFSVSAQQFVLLNEYTPERFTMVKEYSVNVTSSNLDLTFTPSRNSLAFLNGLEVISVPESLIVDDAQSDNPTGLYKGLVSQAMETVARVNVGGKYINYNNDILWRTWDNDDGFLLNNDSARNVIYTGVIEYDVVSSYRAPLNVYNTAKEMNLMNDPLPDANITWVFDVEIGFQYLVRFHFCDIVSKALNELVFNIYLDSWTVCLNFNLSAFPGYFLAAPVSFDAVTSVVARNQLKVIISPSTVGNVYPNAILNGLEIMKLNNSMSSCSGNGLEKSGKVSAGLIVGVTVGVGVSVVLCATLLFFFFKRK